MTIGKQVGTNQESERDRKRWMTIATILHMFYLKNDIHTVALKFDEKVHAKENSAISGLMLAETQLAMKKNAEAVKTLAGLSSEARKSDWAIDALYTIALARDGKIEAAKKAAQATTIPQKVESGRALLAAGVKAVEGDSDAALAMLKKAIETTPPSRLSELKREAKKSPELSALASSDAFAKVLETKSTVSESSCSGGSSCASCPNRGKCSSGGGKSPNSSTPKK